MAFNLEQNIKETLDVQKESRILAEHLRLLGFHSIIEDISLDKYKVEEYCSELHSQFPSFIHLTSGSFLRANINLIGKHELSSVHLPFTENYHLLFFLKSENEVMQEFLYDSCPDCKILSPGEFPVMELRRNVNLEMEETIMYDNRISIRRQDETILKQQYEAIEKFVNATSLD